MKQKNDFAVSELITFMKAEIDRDESVLDELLTRYVELMPADEYREHVAVMNDKQSLLHAVINGHQYYQKG